MNTSQKELIRGKEVLLDNRSFEYGGSWGKDGTNDPLFLEECMKIIEEKNHKVIFDIGSNTGQFIFFYLFKSDIETYCFEPLKPVYDTLNSNILLNDIKNANTYNFALCNEDGESYIYRPENMIACGMSTMGEKALRFKNEFGVVKEKIQCKKLDTFVLEKKLKKIDFIKIDTEGFEYFVLLGGFNTLQKHKPDLVIEYQKLNMSQCGVEEDKLKTLLESIGYNYFKFLSGEDLYCSYV
jgi:FkbM family methyltransferase